MAGVRGLERFREHFEPYRDRYVLIGGAALWLTLDEAGLETRLTRDLDIVLCIEALDAEFARHFWAFVEAGEYQVQEKSTGEKVFYRFKDPKDDNYPEQLELFSRKPDELILGDDSHLTPIPVDEDVSSLSAILLDDDYYAYLHANVIQREGLSVIDERCLIPLKAKAWLDMMARREQGSGEAGRNIAKHRKDIIRLYQILEPDSRIELPEPMARDLAEFLEQARPHIDDEVLRGLKIRDVTPHEILETIRQVFGLAEVEAKE